MSWEIVVGLEIHAQLSTTSKIFSASATRFGAEPNRQADAVDIALPGTLPVLNAGAVERAVKFGLAVGAQINRRSVFARKNYFYPDLPKGYQISQYETPIVAGGEVHITSGDSRKRVRLTRAHLEEDAGKSLHEDFHGQSGIDLNRAGTPLLEIVSEPDLRGAAEAVAYAKAVHGLVTWLGICDGNMQEGSFRCDANVSVRQAGAGAFGTRCEIKNLNSFRFLERAIEVEARRQIELLQDGGAIEQETRLFDPDRDETRPMRSKEDAHDYRYFPDPDLLPLELTDAWIADLRAGLPELPEAKRVRFERDCGLSAYDANLLTSARVVADYFEVCIAAAPGQQKLCANWINGDLAAALNRAALDISASPIQAVQLAGLVKRIADGTLSSKLAKEVFEALWNGATDADAVIEARGLKQISDSVELERVIEDIVAANPTQAADFRAGKDKLLAFFVGQAMKATKGKANPAQLSELLKRKLSN
jgi:aspartyl-tRNA(Asn)/glutamyl-tRNA(Gln) amidotransferase subunit B